MGEKVHLGDAVYAEILPFGVVKLTTQTDGVTTRVIYLRPSVVEALYGFHRKHTEGKEVRA